jgi:hypothetical protein
MSDLLLSAESWLAGVHKASVSQAVVYQRGSSSVTIQATAGDSAIAQLDQGIIVGYSTKDWLVTATDLVLNGRQIVPEQGDTITHGGKVYRVASDASGEKPYRDSGSGGVVLRIFTKQVR